jgi:UDP-2-acetamido-3-amino-2,3-dideoxy-glucuronate N-acetyltransferase
MLPQLSESAPIPTRIQGASLYRLPQFRDDRGMLSICELTRIVPFEVRRYFVVSAAADACRGTHAHHKLHQFLTCIHGQCHAIADDGEIREEFVLDSPSLGLYLPPMTWGTQHRFSPGAVLLVLASDVFEDADYICEYDEFLRLAKAR